MQWSEGGTEDSATGGLQFPDHQYVSSRQDDGRTNSKYTPLITTKLGTQERRVINIKQNTANKNQAFVLFSPP